MYAISFSLFLVYTPMIFFFFFNDTATTEIYTLSLHDALPIFMPFAQPTTANTQLIAPSRGLVITATFVEAFFDNYLLGQDRKSTRLNSSHSQISYAVFCLKKKKTTYKNIPSLTSVYNYALITS